MVAADTGPINYLVWIEAADILHSLYGRVALPIGVIRELSDPRAPEPVRYWVESLPAWVGVHDPGELDPRLQMLGKGEREVIALATRLGVNTVLMDDSEGREAAKARGLVTVRTLAILERASRHIP